MAKTHRGLPSDYVLNVPDELPVQIGDYLDEDEPKIAVAERPTRPVVTQLIREQPPQVPTRPAAQIESAPNKAIEASAHAKGQGRERPTAPRPPRQQVNMDTETERMFGEIVRYVQEYGPQPDARASEVLSGIVRELYRARENISFGEVSRRGAWGSPTAKAFSVALGQAFSKAIIEGYQEEKESEFLKAGNL